jgi:MFS family permease
MLSPAVSCAENLPFHPTFSCSSKKHCFLASQLIRCALRYFFHLHNMASLDATTPLLSRPTDSAYTRRRKSSSDDDQDAAVRTVQATAQPGGLNDEETTIDTAVLIPTDTTPVSVGRIVAVLLIGSFISSADGSLLYATHPIIASEFNALHDSSWLIASFALAQAVSQPLYGKLSDIYGRKAMLILAYTLFTIGLLLVGVGQSMSILILGRVISGLGSSGMTSLVSILITDLVPLRDVATWRSYVNIVATTGRSIGGPLGGWMADTVGWRWSFLGQIPAAGIAILLIVMTLPSGTAVDHDGSTRLSRFRRIDILGATCMTLSILGLLLPLEVGGDRVAWSSPVILVLFAAAAIFGLLFLYVESRVAKEPIVPISLLRHRDVIASGSVMLCQCAAQTSLMFAVPLYFQITSRASNTVAGAHLVPAVVGNALGGVVSGRMIRRTGRYKVLAMAATIFASTGYFFLIVRWHGRTNWLESLYIFPCGLAMGIVQSSLFISIQAGVEQQFSAIAASFLYLTQPTGNVIGLAIASAVLQGTLRQGLDRRLAESGFRQPRRSHIIEVAVSDVHYVYRAKPLIVKAVVGSYIDALMWTHGKFTIRRVQSLLTSTVLSLTCSLIAFVGTMFLRQHKLR